MRQTTKTVFVWVLSTTAFFVSLRAEAVSTRIWVNQTFADFDQGEGSGVAVDSRGFLFAGMNAKRTPLKDVAFVYTMAQQGDHVYVGTADKGEVWLYRSGRVRRLAKLPGAVIVTSLVPWKGGVLAGSLPEGKIFFVGLSGKVRLFAKVASPHIWAMLSDHAGGLFVATGPKGILYRVSATGKVTVYWKAPDKHLLSMAYGPGKALYVGTSPKAIVYRLIGKGRARAVHDFDGTEVRALAGNGRVLFAAVNKMSPARNWDVKVPVRRKQAGTKIKTVTPPGRPKMPIPRKGAKKGIGGVFVIEPNGAADELFGLKRTYFTALEIIDDHAVWAAQGAKGKVMRLGTDHSVATVVDLPERQVLALNLTGKIPCLGTGDAGSLYLVDKKSPLRYQSKAFDAGTASRFGSLSVVSLGQIRIATRTGNTAKPDKNWSRWQPLAGARRLAAARTVGLVASPPGRYFQYRITLVSAKARVQEVRLAYKPINRGQRITELKIGKSPAAGAKSPVLKATWLSGSVKGAAPSEISLSWKVANPDKDPLVYRVYYRALGSAVWRKLGWTDFALTKTQVKWKTQNLPDGWYQVKVVASDEKANAPGRVRKAEKISQPVLVDHTKPIVQAVVVNARRVSGLARDNFSRIVGLHYSLDGKTWIPIDPADGFFDQTAERFSFVLPKSVPHGPVLLLLRAMDEAGNAVVVKKEITFFRFR